MARSVNKAMLLGYVGADPEIRQTAAGKKVASFSLATQRHEETADWHRVTAWEKTADFVEQYVQKGTRLFVEGRIQYREHEGKFYTDIVAYNVVVLSGWAGDGPERGASKPSSSRPRQEQVNPFDDEDDLPF